MSLVLDLPPELETELAAEASRMGMSLSEYALRILATARMAGPKITTGAELIAYWQSAGLVGTRPEINDAAKHARDLRRQAEKRGRP